jgi:hypothetical protein
MGIKMQSWHYRKQIPGKPMKGTSTMYQDNDNAAHSSDLGVPKIESIEDLLKKRGFFDTFEREMKDEEVLVG